MTLQEFLEKQFDEELMLAVLSGQRSKEKDAPSKVRIRQIELKGKVCYQASSTVGTKVLHSNYNREEVIAYVEQCLTEGGFSQLQVQGRRKDGTVLISKKGKATIKVKQHQALEPVQILAHNRVKQYILKEGTPVPFLVDLGVMTKEGKIHRPSYDKFKQILAEQDLKIAVRRHAGKLEYTGSSIQGVLQKGKNLTGIRTVIGTGGPVIRSQNPSAILHQVEKNGIKDDSVLLPERTETYIDRQYVLFAAGLLRDYDEEAALAIMKQSIERLE